MGRNLDHRRHRLTLLEKVLEKFPHGRSMAHASGDANLGLTSVIERYDDIVNKHMLPLS